MNEIPCRENGLVAAVQVGTGMVPQEACSKSMPDLFEMPLSTLQQMITKI